MKKVLLREITSFLARGVAPKYTEKDDFYVLNQKCIRDWRVSLKDARFTDTEAKKVHDDRILRDNDILVNSTGQGTLGRVAQFLKLDRPATVDSHITIVRPTPDLVFPKYLGYALKGRQNEIELLAEGSTGQTELSKLKLANLSIDLPPLDQQKKIADILSSLDEKIELNRRINETLEQLGQALFRHYFVDNPEAKNWDEGTLGDIMNITMGQSPPGKSYNNNGDGVVFYQGRADFGLRYPNIRLFTTDPKRFAKVGDVLLTVRAPVGDVNQASERCCIGRGLAAISSRTGAVSFCYYYCHQLKADFLEYNSEGTVFGSINSKQLKALKLKIPPIGLVEKFENEVAVIDKTIMLNSYQVKTLVVLRDSLLPKLISGGIEV